ncbi:MAG: hypothetical protein ACRBFS_18490 [Aureispira sp.]
MKLISSKAGRLFLFGLVLHIGSLCLPFLDQPTGFHFLIDGIERLLALKLHQGYLLLFAGFYIPWFSFPVFIYRGFKIAPLNYSWYIATIICLLCPHLITIVRVIEWQENHKDWELGYGCWFLSFVLVVLALFYKGGGEEDPTDLSPHLIEEE